MTETIIYDQSITLNIDVNISRVSMIMNVDLVLLFLC